MSLSKNYLDLELHSLWSRELRTWVKFAFQWASFNSDCNLPLFLQLKKIQNQQNIDASSVKMWWDLWVRSYLYNLSPLNTSQIGILVPIKPQRRSNGTPETGSSINYLKKSLLKPKKATKRGNFHSPLWTYLIRTIDYILAPTKHLENFIIIVLFVFTWGSFT
jgi:hypothetical protein